MPSFIKNILFLELLFISLYILLYSGYQYNIDPDATGYLSVAERWAAGDTYNAINGLWSPLGSWMVAPFIRLGCSGMQAAKWLNGFYGILSVGMFYSLMRRFSQDIKLTFAVSFVALVMILNFAYYRLFGDFLQVTLLLIYLNIICSPNFGNSYLKIFFAALIGALAFYSKAFTFYFIIGHLPFVIFYFEKKSKNIFFSKQVMYKILLAIFTLFASVTPWIIALKYKYGVYCLSRTGHYHLQGFFSGTGPKTTLLFPPPYPTAYSIWDDLSIACTTNFTPFTNVTNFLLQIKIALSNTIILVNTLNGFSFIYLTSLIIAVILIIKKYRHFTSTGHLIILLSFITLWSFGIILLHIEERFLWILALLGLVLTGSLLSALKKSNWLSKKAFIIVTAIVLGSFCAPPILHLKAFYKLNEPIFKMASAFKENNITGNIVSKNNNEDEMINTVLLNYLIKGKYFGALYTDYKTDEFIEAIKKYNIDYCILYYESGYQKDEILASILAKQSKRILMNVYPGVIVLSFK